MLLPIVLATILALSVISFTICTARLLSILPPRRSRPAKRRRNEATQNHIMILLGSGGHTAEMVIMLTELNLAATFKRRTWVISEGDAFSGLRAKEFEDTLSASSKGGFEKGSYDIITIPRARKVHQSLLSTPISSLFSLYTCLRLLAKSTPDILLTNGPGTGVILVFASIFLRVFGLGAAERTRIVYVESLARVKRLSLSGRILSRIVDRFVVQWERLAQGHGEYRGDIVLESARRIGLEDARVKRNNGQKDLSGQGSSSKRRKVGI